MSEYQHKERDAYLRNLSEEFPMAWKSVRRTVERGSGSAYDEARCALAERAGQGVSSLEREVGVPSS